MTKGKKKQRIFFKQKHYYVALVVLLLIVSILVAYFGRRVDTINQDGMPAAIESAREEAELYTKCEHDPKSTDKVLPTIKIVNPRDGSTMPFSAVYDVTKNIYRGVELQIVAQDDMGFNDESGNVGNQSRAWVIIDGKDYIGLVPTSKKDKVDSFGVHSLGFFSYDEYENPRPIGSEVRYQFGVCDAAGNKTLSNIITVTVAR